MSKIVETSTWKYASSLALRRAEFASGMLATESLFLSILRNVVKSISSTNSASRR